MSLTCAHPDEECHQHPECPGCAALLCEIEEHERAARPAPTSLQWTVHDSDPIADIARAIADQRAEIERQEQKRRKRSEPIDCRYCDGNHTETWHHEHVPGSGSHARAELSRHAQGWRYTGAEIRAARRAELPLLHGHRADRLIIDDPAPRPSLLATRDLTPEERAAHDELPRPGVWAGEDSADLRALTQDETDAQIRNEIWLGASTPAEQDELEDAFGRPRVLMFDGQPGMSQRGGIDSDPLVRLLAYRAWGERDRRWFELRGVRKGDRVRTVPLVGGGFGARVVLAWSGESGLGVAQHDARPGDQVAVDDGRDTWWFVVGDRLRAEPDLQPDRNGDILATEMRAAGAALCPPEIYRELVAGEIRRAIDRGELPQDVARRIAGQVQLTSVEVWELVDAEVQRRFRARGFEIDTSGIPITSSSAQPDGTSDGFVVIAEVRSGYISLGRRDPAPRPGGMCSSPAPRQQPPVPPWARKRKQRAAAPRSTR